MANDDDIAALLRGGPFDPVTIERLRAVDREELRVTLGRYLDDAAVARVLARIDALVSTLP